MKNYLRLLVLLGLFFTSFVTFAQNSDDNTGGGNLDGEDLPINGSLIYLALAGILFAWYSINSFRKRHRNS